VVAEYLDEMFPDAPRILPTDPYERAKHKMLIERIGSTLTGAFYGVLYNSKDPEKLKNFTEALKFIDEQLTSVYFSGTEPGFADFMLWPWFERLEPMIKIIGENSPSTDVAITHARYPHLATYIERMAAREELREVIRSPEQHMGFIRSAIAGNPNYDFGI